MDILQSIQQGFATFFGYIPQLIGAIVVLIIGYIVARVLEGVLVRILGRVGFDGLMERSSSTGRAPT